MTVSSTVAQASAAGDGVSTEFDIPPEIVISAAPDIKALVRDTTTGVETALTYNVDYEVDEAGRTITYPKAGSGQSVMSSDEELHYWREVAPTQELDLTDGALYSLEPVETALDRSMLAIQDLKTEMALTVKKNRSDPDEVPSVSDVRTYANEAAAARDLAQSWAESDTEPGEAGTKSAKTWAGEAATQVGYAQGYAGDAQDWAEMPEDTEVIPGEGVYSALHHAAKAANVVAGALQADQNLSDVADPATARINLGVTPDNIGAADNALSNLPDNAAALLNILAGAQFMCVRDLKTSGTNGGDFNTGGWRTRTINDVLYNNITGATLNSNEVTLPAGTYLVMGRAPASQVDRHQARVFDNTGSVMLLQGATAYAPGGTAAITDSTIQGVFTLAAQGAISVDHFCSTSKASTGFGAAGSIVQEIYTELFIWRIA